MGMVLYFELDYRKYLIKASRNYLQQELPFISLEWVIREKENPFVDRQNFQVMLKNRIIPN